MKAPALIIAVAGLAVGTPTTSMAEQSKTPSSTSAAPTGTKPGLPNQWQKLESELHKIFHDTVGKLFGDQEDKAPIFSVSVNLRENRDAYVARIYLPKRDQAAVKITYANGQLHIASSDKAAGSYEENIAIAGPVNADKMKVEHTEGIVVVTLPKESKGIVTASTIAPDLTPWKDDWDQQVASEMQKMHHQMNRITHDMFSGLPNAPSISKQYFTSATVSLQDEKDKYVVHFYLPDVDLANVKVEEKNNQLYLTASEELKEATSSKIGTSEQITKKEYSQIITLPGPVNAERIKIDRKEGAVVVTLPKV